MVTYERYQALHTIHIHVPGEPGNEANMPCYIEEGIYTFFSSLKKTEKAWECLYVNDVWWIHGGHRGRSPYSNSCAINDTVKSNNVDLVNIWGPGYHSRKHSMMKSSSNEDPSPAAITSRPPDVIHMIGIPRPSLFSPLFRFCECKPNNNDNPPPPTQKKKRHEFKQFE